MEVGAAPFGYSVTKKRVQSSANGTTIISIPAKGYFVNRSKEKNTSSIKNPTQDIYPQKSE
jgi:hypothetical protein